MYFTAMQVAFCFYILLSLWNKWI